MRQGSPGAGWLAVLTGVLMFSTDSIILRQIALPPIIISCGSHLVTALVLGAWQWQNLPRWLPYTRNRAAMIRLLILGILRSSGAVAFVSAIFLAPVAKVVVISYLFPIYTMFLAYRFLGEPLTGRFVSAALVALVGIVVLVLPGLGPTSGGEWPGLLLAGYVGVSIAIGRVVLKDIAAPIPNQFIMLMEAVIAAATLAPFALLTLELPIPGRAATLVVVNGVLYGVAARTIILIGLRRVPAGPAAVLGYVEPVSTSLLAWWLLAEPISFYTLCGGVLILGGSLLAVLSQIRQTAMRLVSYQDSTGI